ncbi:hypothetical protein AAFF_G00393390 [Aldrovandia affinis]|uniref:Uncharacterized protein n=1 Tax=Aldrovandia affinis TaxID=143900 RepID=A0AAD7SDI2_9TELE|nr:hypothetical protein AAFF_G00393390 [Aldrovandia affinis]
MRSPGSTPAVDNSSGEGEGTRTPQMLSVEARRSRSRSLHLRSLRPAGGAADTETGGGLCVGITGLRHQRWRNVVLPYASADMTGTN